MSAVQKHYYQNLNLQLHLHGQLIGNKLPQHISTNYITHFPADKCWICLTHRGDMNTPFVRYGSPTEWLNPLQLKTDANVKTNTIWQKRRNIQRLGRRQKLFHVLLYVVMSATLGWFGLRTFLALSQLKLNKTTNT